MTKTVSEILSAAADLPAPRLQFRWEAWDKPSPASGVAYEWACHYELVLPLRKFDIRREVYDEDGNEIGEKTELVIAMKPPTLRGSSSVPCDHDPADTPFRDGAHAQWDAPHLGNPPVYVIAPDGSASKVPAKLAAGDQP